MCTPSIDVIRTSTPGGLALFNLVQKLWDHNRQPADVEEILDVINSRVCSPDDIDRLLRLCPRAVVLRNVVKLSLSMYLAKNHASQLGVRFTHWRCADVGIEGAAKRQLSPECIRLLDGQDCSKTQNLDAFLAFFPGCRYSFATSEMPEIGWCNNGLCTGVRLLLHPDEPADDVGKSFRRLENQPVGIVVRLEDADIGDVLMDERVPSGCVPVKQKSVRFQVRGPLGACCALASSCC